MRAAAGVALAASCALAACGEPAPPPSAPASESAPHAPDAVILLEAIEEARLEPVAREAGADVARQAGADVARPAGGAAAAAPPPKDDERLRIEIPPGAGWGRLPERRAKALGAGDPALSAWHLVVRLPTRDAGSVRFDAGGRPLVRWSLREPPPPFAAAYNPGGFLGQGIFLALPAAEDPNRMALGASFAPEPPVRAAARVRAGRAVSPADLLTHAILGDVSRPALLLAPDAAVAFPVRMPRAPVLRLGLGVEAPGRRPGDAELLVGFRTAPDDPPAPRARLAFGTASRWHERRVDLSALGGLEGELVLRLETGDRSAATLHHVGDPVLASGADVQAAKARADRPPNLLLIVVDGLRADRLEGRARAELTPRIAALAGAGLEYTQARAPAPWTRPTISSLFTGVAPARHGIERETVTDALPAVLPTLAEALRGAGYAAAGFSANLHVHSAFGMQRGFGYLYTQLVDGRELNDRALAWLDSRTHDPFFLFLFHLDTHHPFRHRPEHDRSSGIAAEPPTRAQVTKGRPERRALGVPDPTPAQRRLLEALYDENVRYSDERVGELVDALAARGLLDDTLVVVTADHGEAFGEHGELFHGFHLHEELLRVPLVLAGPGLPAGERRDAPVSLVDLPAALLSLLGVDTAGVGEDAAGVGGDAAGVGEDAAGVGGDAARLLAPAAAAQPVRHHFETRFRGADAAAVLDPPHKLIWDRRRDRLALYDLARDPGERRNLADQAPGRTAELSGALRGWLEARAEERARDGGRAHDAGGGALPADTIEQLEALGYVP